MSGNNVNDPMSRHHLIAKFKGGTWHEDNIINIRRSTHDAVHFLFSNDLPIEILRGVTERYKRTLDGDAYELINGVLRKVEHTLDAYNQKCFYPERLKLFI